MVLHRSRYRKDVVILRARLQHVDQSMGQDALELGAAKL